MAKILLVEDNEMNRDMLSRRLIKRGFDVVTAIDGQQGVEMAASESPDLILLDFLMPEINGFEVCKALRENELTRSTPIMAVTCLTKEQDIERIFDSGADEYLAKPFKVEDLVEKVRDLIGRGRVVE